MSEPRNEAFDEMLDECYEPFKIGDMTFYASDILRDCDPIAYRIAVGEYEDELEEELEQENIDILLTDAELEEDNG
jgi:hypothetical protein